MNKILRDIASAEWAIEPRVGERLLNQFLEQPTAYDDYEDDEDYDKTKPSTKRIGGLEWQVRGRRFYQHGSVAMVEIKEAMTAEDNLCGVGSLTMADYIAQALADDSVSAIVLYIDSPGGMVKGTQTLAEAVASSRGKKPVAALVQGMAASAAYFVASAAEKIYVSEPSSMLGSIGVMTTLVDYTKLQDEQGIKVHRIYAAQSGDKNKPYEEALKGKYEAMRTEMLNPLADNFIGFVRRVRPRVSEEALSGKMYVASAAIEAGLADGMGTLQSIVQNFLSTNHITNPVTTMNRWSNIKALFGFAPVADQNGAQIPTHELDAMDKRGGELQAQLDAANATIADQKAQIEALQAQVKAAQDGVSLAAKMHESLREEVRLALLGRETATEGGKVLTAADVKAEAQPKHEYEGTKWAKELLS